MTFYTFYSFVDHWPDALLVLDKVLTACGVSGIGGSDRTGRTLLDIESKVNFSCLSAGKELIVRAASLHQDQHRAASHSSTYATGTTSTYGAGSSTYGNGTSGTYGNGATSTYTLAGMNERTSTYKIGLSQSLEKINNSKSNEISTINTKIANNP